MGQRPGRCERGRTREHRSRVDLVDQLKAGDLVEQLGAGFGQRSGRVQREGSKGTSGAVEEIMARSRPKSDLFHDVSRIPSFLRTLAEGKSQNKAASLPSRGCRAIRYVLFSALGFKGNQTIYHYRK